MRIPYASLKAFKAKANLLESLLNLKGRRRTLELMSRLSGYASFHEVSHADLTPGPPPTVGQVEMQLSVLFPEKPPAQLRHVAEALGLHLTEKRLGKKGQTAQEMKFDALYITKTPLDEKALFDFEFPLHREGRMLRSLSFDPAEQALELKRTRSPMFYLRSHAPSTPHPDLPQVEPEYFGGASDYTPSDEELSDWWGHHIECELFPKYAGPSVPAPLTDEESEILWEFWRAPSASVAENHVILRTIPDVVNLAQQWKAHHVEAYARMNVSESPTYTVLVNETSLPSGVAWASPYDRISCSLAFKRSEGVELDEDDNLSLWEYSACFMLTGGRTARAKPIALMVGTHIVPFSMRAEEFEATGSGFFADMMDAHSAMLNDVWKVLEFKYFPDAGYEDVNDFAWENMGGAFTVASLEIEPDLRGEGLAPLLLNLFITTVDGFPSTELDEGWESACGLPEDEDAEGSSMTLGRPVVLIFPVPGTEPQRKVITPESLLLVHSPEKVDLPDKDPDAERRKQKLSTHFLSMADEVKADIVVYDPWEYPMT